MRKNESYYNDNTLRVIEEFNEIVVNSNIEHKNRKEMIVDL